VEVEISPGLNDLAFGAWEGLSVDAVRVKYPDLFAMWASHPERARLPGGETLDEVGRRAGEVVNQAAANHKGTVVMVTHRVVIKVLVCALLGLDNSHFWRILVDTCGLTTFRYDGGRAILVRHNDSGFLRPMREKPLDDF
jgi:broad specificity phosphatase PhoE